MLHIVKKFATLTLCEDIIIYYQGKFWFLRLCVRNSSISSVSSCVCKMIGLIYKSIDIRILRNPYQPLSMKIFSTICMLGSGTTLPSMGKIHPIAKIPISTPNLRTYIKGKVRDGDIDHNIYTLTLESDCQ